MCSFVKYLLLSIFQYLHQVQLTLSILDACIKICFVLSTWVIIKWEFFLAKLIRQSENYSIFALLIYPFFSNLLIHIIYHKYDKRNELQ